MTRDSILALARAWNEFDVTEGAVSMAQLTRAIQEGRVHEMFGAGTAAVVSPIRKIHYQEKVWNVPLDPSDPTSQAGPLARRLWEAITSIQYGVIPHEWSVIVD